MPARLTTGRHFYLFSRRFRQLAPAGVAITRVFIMSPLLATRAVPLSAAILKGRGHMGGNQAGWDRNN